MSELTEYQQGFIAGLREFAWWLDGVQYVGSCGTTLKSAIAKYLLRQGAMPAPGTVEYVDLAEAGPPPTGGSTVQPPKPADLDGLADEAQRLAKNLTDAVESRLDKIEDEIVALRDMMDDAAYGRT